MLVVGLPSPAACAPSKTWRAAAEAVRERLGQRFGKDVSLEYVELFSDELAHHPEVEAWIASGASTAPLVAIDGVLHSSGGKLHISAIERAVAARLQRRPTIVAANVSRAAGEGRFDG